MNLFLINGIPGTKKKDVAKKIIDFLKLKEISTGIGNVEDELVKIFKEKGSPKTMSLKKAIGSSCITEISTIWAEAYERAVAKSILGNPIVSIVILTLEYYKSETYEFYSPINHEVLLKSSPKNILTLIDDIYDCYYHLSRDGEVFAESMIGQEVDSKLKGGLSVPLRLKYKTALQWVIKNLQRILIWRWREIEAGAALAKSLGINQNVLATKHPIEHGVFLLLGEHTAEFPNIGEYYSIYISHPISRPREMSIGDGNFPKFVDHLSDVIGKMHSNRDGKPNIIAIMPTAIDEFRIFSDRDYLYPLLSKRWPFDESNSLWSLPPEFTEYKDFERDGIGGMFNPPINGSGDRLDTRLPKNIKKEIFISDAEISGMLRTFIELMTMQMSGRDHLLVKQSFGFFLYRPLFDEIKFSRGVQMELITYEKIFKSESKGKRRVFFVHDIGEARDLLKKAGTTLSIKLNTKVREILDLNGHRYESNALTNDADLMRVLDEFESLNETHIEKLYEKLFSYEGQAAIGQQEKLPLSAFQPGFEEVIMDLVASQLSSLLLKKESLVDEENNSFYKGTLGANQFSGKIMVVHDLDEDEKREKVIEQACDFYLN